MPVGELYPKSGKPVAMGIRTATIDSRQTTNIMTASTTTANETYNGWANYETWNASLWISNDEFLYNTAKACVKFCSEDETPWDKFQRCMCEGQIGRMLCKTADGVAWDDAAIDADEMNEMMAEL